LKKVIDDNKAKKGRCGTRFGRDKEFHETDPAWGPKVSQTQSTAPGLKTTKFINQREKRVEIG